jgi:hypothetical protein
MIKKSPTSLVGYNLKTKRKTYIPVWGSRILRGGPFKRARDADLYVGRVKRRYINWLKTNYINSHSKKST